MRSGSTCADAGCQLDVACRNTAKGSQRRSRTRIARLRKRMREGMSQGCHAGGRRDGDTVDIARRSDDMEHEQSGFGEQVRDRGPGDPPGLARS